MKKKTKYGGIDRTQFKKTGCTKKREYKKRKQYEQELEKNL